MAKVVKRTEDIGRISKDENGNWGRHEPKIIDSWVWFCPGCGFNHSFWMDGRWTFDGNIESPTFSPSLLLKKEDGWAHQCHTFVRGGVIEFLGDCSHELVGTSVAMKDISEDK